jgi:CubicO group peptidase (beta-lactamase class C family)
MILRVLLAIGLLLPCQTPAANNESTSRAHIRRVESELLPITATRDKLGSYADIHDRMRAYAVAGLSVAVIENGHIAWARGYGVADTGTGAAVTPDTLFQAASISKPLAALGALLLVEHDRLGLDDDVNRHLKAWKIPTNAFTAAHPVTLRTLLDHSSALTDIGFDNYSPAQPLPALSDVLKNHSAAIRVESAPGRQYSYSATGYVALQQLMVDVTGQPFDMFMQSNVLRPLGMAHSTFAHPLPESLRRSAAMGHYSGGQRLPDGYRVGPELAVAGLWSTPSDLARYIIAVQQWHAGARRGLIGPNLTKQMLSPQIGHAGLGVVLSGDGEHVRFGHDGFNEGYESSIVGYIHGGRGAVVMANSGFAYMLIKEILESIAHVYEWPHYGSTNQWPPSASIRQQEITKIPQGLLSAAVGHYSLDANTVVRVFARDERLYLHWPRNGEAEIFSTPDGRLFCPQLTFSELGDPFLRFNVQKDSSGGELLAADGHVVLRRMN